MEWNLFHLAGLACAQVFLYRSSSKQALKAFYLLGVFYFCFFPLAQGLKIFCVRFSLSGYELPLLVLALFFVFGGKTKRLPHFPKAYSGIPDFYFLSSLWISLIWLEPLSAPEPFLLGAHLWKALFGAFLAAALFAILTGIKERLALLEVPKMFEGLPIFLTATGFLLLSFTFFIKLMH